jgi:hypothetical protein
LTTREQRCPSVTEWRERDIAIGLARLKGEALDQIAGAFAIKGFADAMYLEVDDGAEAFLVRSCRQH